MTNETITLKINDKKEIKQKKKIRAKIWLGSDNIWYVSYGVCGGGSPNFDSLIKSVKLYFESYFFNSTVVFENF